VLGIICVLSAYYLRIICVLPDVHLTYRLMELQKFV